MAMEAPGERRSENGVRVRTDAGARKTITRNFGKERCHSSYRANNIGPAVGSGWQMRIAWWVLTLVMATAAHSQSAGSKVTPDLYRQMLEDLQYWDAQGKRYRAVIERAH